MQIGGIILPESGQIRIRTYASRAVLPLKDSTVVIELENGGRTTLLAVRQTDESGLTPYITVETPSVVNSQKPDQARGWTNVTVIVSHPDYRRVIIRNVQIFPGIISQQAVEMVPLEQFPETGDLTEQYDIPPQDL